MKSIVTIKPAGQVVEVENGMNVLSLLRQQGMVIDAPCGGNGKCGMCNVEINGSLCSACKSTIEKDSVIVLSQSAGVNILNADYNSDSNIGCCIAVDIGTTTVACSLIKNGKTEKTLSALNPQQSFGADVVSRLNNICKEQTRLIRSTVLQMICQMCNPSEVEIISVTANPAMQQIFLGFDVNNLVIPPYSRVIKKAEYIPAARIIKELTNAKMLIIPQIAAYVGADALCDIMAARLYEEEKPCLLIDIGTNAEIVLGCRDKLICTATAAGPALEGAEISCGMRASIGVIDQVYMSEDGISVHVLGETEPEGMCGSGIVDAVAVLLEKGNLNKRGRILPKADSIVISGNVALTQEDITQVQLAKAAICGGIYTLIKEYGISVHDIDKVYIAGTFGNYINVNSACRIGLLPEELKNKTKAAGNLAQYGAASIALDSVLFEKSEKIASGMDALDLGNSDTFKRLFAENMYFKQTDE